MRGGTARILLAMLALACGLLPGAASAAAATYGSYDALHLERGRYQVSVTNLGQSVGLTVETGATNSLRHVATTSYVAHGTATESRLAANYGQLGEISLRFHPSPDRSWVKPHRNCKSLDYFVRRHGTWVGTLRFRGEDGYLALDRERIAGTVETVAPECRGAAGFGGSARRALIAPSDEPPLGPEVPVVQAHWREGVRAAEFVGGATRHEGSNFFASVLESRGQVSIFRAAHATGGRRAVRANSALTSARLSAPSPFHGSARYRAAADGSRTWDGGLYVAFPGAPHFALTGKPYLPSLELFPELLVGLIGFSAVDHGMPDQLSSAARDTRERRSSLAR